MIQTLEELAKVLQSTVLKDSNITSIETPESKRLAFAIEVPRSTMLDCWRLMRSLTDITQMYPILNDYCLATTENWYQDLIEEDFFSRFYYKEEQQAGCYDSILPESIIDAAKNINGKEAIETRIEQSERIADETWRESDWYLYDLDITQRNFGISPDQEAAEAVLNSGKIITEVDFERWLFNWELSNVSPEQLLAVPDLTHLEWYDLNSADTVPLLLLPTPNSWDILAYIHFFGAINSAEAIAILKYWYERYGAEVVAAYGTMLHFYVKQKPKTLNEAFELACQHNEFAPCTLILPGVSIREHARALLHTDRWFLHERP
ncbi:MAG: DUF4253 domain-containing protein [Cyanobacteria bacterium P01_A01_bin.40]